MENKDNIKDSITSLFYLNKKLKIRLKDLDKEIYNIEQLINECKSIKFNKSSRNNIINLTSYNNKNLKEIEYLLKLDSIIIKLEKMKVEFIKNRLDIIILIDDNQKNILNFKKKSTNNVNTYILK